ncbi:hypothetical protein [Desulfosarcina sp. BuS5]|uniref:hypothetical protein n=1 Tax=Desulfosarcina sp. BuS5 TaxID=933262 RepID=UPI0018DDA42D|nr:hypothetical protein [Desulfosarcina sp. BuS5]
MIAILLFFSSGLKLPLLDTATEVYFREAITKAGVAYATCRVVNAAVSIVKDSTLQLEPAGVGVSLAVGQALDPIDDMTERLSDVLVMAITSLGVQKLAYEISVSLVPPILSMFLLSLSIMIWFENERLNSFQKIIMRFLLLIVIARFCLPISSMANEFVHKHFFADQISVANKELAIGIVELDKLKDFSLPEIDGVLGTIENSTSFLQRKSIEFKNAIAATVSNMGAIIENLLKLTFLYVGIFLIQVIILPLLSFWFLVKIVNPLFYTNVPVILHHSRPYNAAGVAVFPASLLSDFCLVNTFL